MPNGTPPPQGGGGAGAFCKCPNCGKVVPIAGTPCAETVCPDCGTPMEDKLDVKVT